MKPSLSKHTSVQLKSNAELHHSQTWIPKPVTKESNETLTNDLISQKKQMMLMNGGVQPGESFVSVKYSINAPQETLRSIIKEKTQFKKKKWALQ